MDCLKSATLEIKPYSSAFDVVVLSSACRGKVMPAFIDFFALLQFVLFKFDVTVSKRKTRVALLTHCIEAISNPLTKNYDWYNIKCIQNLRKFLIVYIYIYNFFHSHFIPLPSESENHVWLIPHIIYTKIIWSKISYKLKILNLKIREKYIFIRKYVSTLCICIVYTYVCKYMFANT